MGVYVVDVGMRCVGIGDDVMAGCVVIVHGAYAGDILDRIVLVDMCDVCVFVVWSMLGALVWLMLLFNHNNNNRT